MCNNNILLHFVLMPHDCLLSRLFGHRSKKISKHSVNGHCVGKLPGTGEFPAQMASNAENVSIWWRHHESSLQTNVSYIMILLSIPPYLLMLLSRRYMQNYDQVVNYREKSRKTECNIMWQICMSTPIVLVVLSNKKHFFLLIWFLTLDVFHNTLQYGTQPIAQTLNCWRQILAFMGMLWNSILNIWELTFITGLDSN